VRLDGKRILVTGADGFIGSHLTETLTALGCQVTAFCFYNSFDSWGWLDTVPGSVRESIEVVMGDVRDPSAVRSAVRGSDAVFHLAALIGIPFSYRAPDSYVDTNVRGTLNVLQAARECDVGRVVVTSTSEVYGTAQYAPIDEGHPRQGQSPYSASKIGADAMAEAFHRSFDLPVVIARPFNTYGPRQSTRAVIPTIIAQVLSHAAEIRLGSLSPTRDLTFVTDTCAGFVALASSDGAVGRDVNMGTGREISIGDLAALILEMMGSSARIVTEDARVRPDASEVNRLLSDNSLAGTLCGWEPRVSLREGLGRTIDWFSSASPGPGHGLGYTV